MEQYKLGNVHTLCIEIQKLNNLYKFNEKYILFTLFTILIEFNNLILHIFSLQINSFKQ